jgi:hypothetical protein
MKTTNRWTRRVFHWTQWEMICRLAGTPNPKGRLKDACANGSVKYLCWGIYAYTGRVVIP